MKAAVSLPAPNGLDDEINNRAIYELSKLGTINTRGPLDQGAIEVFTVPEEMKPAGAPKELPFFRFVADLTPYIVPKDHGGLSL